MINSAFLKTYNFTLNHALNSLNLKEFDSLFFDLTDTSIGNVISTRSRKINGKKLEKHERELLAKFPIPKRKLSEEEEKEKREFDRLMFWKNLETEKIVNDFRNKKKRGG